MEHNLLDGTKALWGLVSPHRQRQREFYEAGVDWDDTAMDRLGKIGVVIVCIVMLVLPLWILAVVKEQFRRLAIITVFLLGLVTVLTWATLAKPYEVLAATAGYVDSHGTCQTRLTCAVDLGIRRSWLYSSNWVTSGYWFFQFCCFEANSPLLGTRHVESTSCLSSHNDIITVN